MYRGLMLDLKIVGGTLVDGTGGPARAGDVGVQDGRIVAVGRVSGPARREVDAAGAIVAPGFIDLHTHYDGQALWDAALAPSSWHGVTAVMMGNCGVGFAPLRPGDAGRLVRLMEGVEEIPGTALYEGLDWRWETFGDYLDRLAEQPRAIDVATQVPHDPVRLYVMGDRAARQEAATADDVAAMRAIVREALEAGAFGFSTGRTDTHRTSDGLATPAALAAGDELVAIASALRGLPYRVLSAVSDFDMFRGEEHFDPEFDVFEQMARAAGRPLTLSTLERLGFPDQWRRIVARVERARESGLDLRMQISPRGVGVLTGLRTTLNVFVGKPTYRALMHLPHAELVAALRNPEVRAKILGEPFIKVSEVDPSAPPQIDQSIAMLEMIAFRMFELADPPDYEPPAEQSIGARAAARGVGPLEEIFDVMLRDEGEGLVYFPIFNYNRGNLDVVAELMAHPATHLGLGDGGAHVGTIADAAWTTFFLQHWARDRPAARLPVERAVRMISADPAAFLGLADRGQIVEGMRADLNVIDWPNLGLRRPHLVYDLPGGGRRLVQEARGYVMTTVAGVPILEHDRPTGATPGQVLRAPR
jgi:N-acyl-D-aspartate/D-glutamate deacylase